MSPSDWYRPDPEFPYGQPRPGTFPPEGAPLRFLGGHLDGARERVPRENALRMPYPVAPLAYRLSDDAPPTEMGYRTTTYLLRQLVHAPEKGCEGPIGVEWVFVTEDLYRYMLARRGF